MDECSPLFGKHPRSHIHTRLGEGPLELDQVVLAQSTIRSREKVAQQEAQLVLGVLLGGVTNGFEDQSLGLTVRNTCMSTLPQHSTGRGILTCLAMLSSI